MSVVFFRAEDGIRVDLVTGVQTCALPISRGRSSGAAPRRPRAWSPAGRAAGNRARPVAGATGRGRVPAARATAAAPDDPGPLPVAPPTGGGRLLSARLTGE